MPNIAGKCTLFVDAAGRGLMGTPELNAVIQQRDEVAPGLVVIRVVPDGWELPDFTPGQFAVLGLPPEAPRCELADPDEEEHKPGKLIRRAYSIASSSVAKAHLELYITLVRSGALTPRLFALEPGDRVWLGPKITGKFTLDDAPDDADLVLVATGTGLAPYMSMLRTMLPDGDGRRIAVFLGARHSWDLGYQAELLTLARRHPTFTYQSIISRPKSRFRGAARPATCRICGWEISSSRRGARGRRRNLRGSFSAATRR
jgi:ferredoxin--NADP+ reductase